MAIGWAQAAVPVALAVLGVGAIVVGAQQEPDDGPIAVWIDAPLVGTVLTVGDVDVIAHASGSNPPSEIELLVDGTSVGFDRSLDTTDNLAVARITWSAGPGDHVLTARTADGAESQPRPVVVRSDAATPTPPTTTTDATTTTTDPAATTTTGTPATAPIPTSTTAVTTTDDVPAPPQITSALVTDPSLSPDPECLELQATVTVQATDTTSARLRVIGTEFRVELFASPAGWTGAIPSGFADRVGNYDVEVEVTGPGGTATRVAGRVSMRIDCPTT
jgi:hypothetical protein